MNWRDSSISRIISYFFLLGCYEYYFWVVCGGCDEPTLCCCACIWVSLVSSTVSLDGQCCVIMECRHGWKQQENKVQHSLSLSLKDPPPHVPLCLSVHLSASIYLSVLLSALSFPLPLPHFSSQSVHANVQNANSAPGLSFEILYCSPFFSRSHVSSC